MRLTFPARSRLFVSLVLVLLAAGLSAQGKDNVAAGAATGVNLFPAPGAEGTGESELTALAAAYPDRISGAELHDDDWAVRVDGEWFFWAHGRILPSAELADWQQYARYRFYPYPLGGLPPLPTLDADTAARLRKVLEESRTRPPRRSEAFLERLFQAGSHAETLQRIVSTDFLGFHLQVHRRIVGALREVAAECEAARRSDPQTAAFFASLAEIDGFNYRDVAGTLSRSYHGYGLAVDLIPKRYGGRAPYWRWVMDRENRRGAGAGTAVAAGAGTNAAAPAATGSARAAGPTDWWETPYERRWAVPQTVVAAFERHGFVWGGKWLFFDTMHFEYRPEILILARQAERQPTP